jgi:hypothetical protein
MSQVFRFSRLPDFVQQEIKGRLIANSFSDFTTLADELRGRGFRISKSSLHRVAQILRSDAKFLHAWALDNPVQAAALVVSLKAGGKVNVNVTAEVAA